MCATTCEFFRYLNIVCSKFTLDRECLKLFAEKDYCMCQFEIVFHLFLKHSCEFRFFKQQLPRSCVDRYFLNRHSGEFWHYRCLTNVLCRCCKKLSINLIIHICVRSRLIFSVLASISGTWWWVVSNDVFGRFLKPYVIYQRPVPPRRLQNNALETEHVLIRSISLRLKAAGQNY